MGASGVSGLINYDSPETYLPLIDRVLRIHLSTKILGEIKKYAPKYCDTASDIVLRNVDQEVVFKQILDELSNSRFSIYHATRIHESNRKSFETTGILPLLNANRLDLLKKQIQYYLSETSQVFDNAKFEQLCEKHYDRDAGEVFFSLSGEYHNNDCPAYLYFGSEFDQITVVHLLSRPDRVLLRKNTSPVLLVWEIAGEDLKISMTAEEIQFCLRGGGYPVFARLLINNWVLNLCGQKDRIKFVNGDVTFTFKQPFPPITQRLIWINDDDIKPAVLF